MADTQKKTAPEPKYAPGMTGQQFFENQVDASDVFEEPFNMRMPSDPERIKAMCELCQIKEEGWCCPEHCCDVSEIILDISNHFCFVLKVGFVSM